MSEYLKKKWVIVLIIIFVGLSGVSGVRTVADIFLGTQNVEVIENLLLGTIDKAVDKAFQEHGYEFPIGLIEESFKDCTTREQVENKIKLFNDKGFKSQITAIKVVAQNKYAIEKLKKKMYDPKFVHIIMSAYN